MNWERLDWSKGNTDLAKEVGVTRQAIAYHRARLGLPSPPHGGKRENAGRSDKKTIRISGVPKTLFSEIETAKSKRKVSIHQWAVEAFSEKVEREK